MILNRLQVDRVRTAFKQDAGDIAFAPNNGGRVTLADLLDTLEHLLP